VLVHAQVAAAETAPMTKIRPPVEDLVVPTEADAAVVDAAQE